MFFHHYWFTYLRLHSFFIFSFSSKLITIVARLHSLLGIDSEAARLFAELRKKCGHPAAFRNEETSEMSLLVAEQCEAIILNKMTKRKTEDEIHAIRFHVEQGKNYRESLHRVILALAESDKPNLGVSDRSCGWNNMIHMNNIM